jgi:hypothetical protein
MYILPRESDPVESDPVESDSDEFDLEPAATVPVRPWTP